jgi:hypothetical protein
MHRVETAIRDMRVMDKLLERSCKSVSGQQYVDEGVEGCETSTNAKSQRSGREALEFVTVIGLRSRIRAR